MAKKHGEGEGEKRPRFEVEPPRRPRCPRCGSERLRVVYTTVYRESGFRRVTAECADCGAICWWDAPLIDKKN
jgi:transcription elongation factor Elf1